MKVVTNPQGFEDKFVERLVELFGSAAEAKRAYNERYPGSKFERLYDVALCEATEGMSPTLRRGASVRILSWE